VPVEGKKIAQRQAVWEVEMVFTFVFLANLARLFWNGAPLFLGLGVIIAALAIAAGRREGWSTGDSLYYGFITATTVGYGDMTPTTGRSKIYAIILAMIGLIFTGIIVALAVEAAGTTYDQL
jgi:voltage-gated potassium channel